MAPDYSGPINQSEMVDEINEKLASQVSIPSNE